MNMCWGTLFGSGVASALVMPVQAAGVQRIYDGLSANQYLQIMIAALILVAVFIGIFYVIGKRNARRTKVNPVARNVALILAILYLTVGTLLLITDFIVLIEPYVATDVFAYVVQIFRYYFPEIVFGIIIVGAAGLLLYLVGFYIMIFVQEPTEIVKDDESYHIRAPPEMETEVSRERMDNSGIAFRVTDWETKEPLSDGKICLETKNGTLMMIKYTDFTGEVDFGKLCGTGDDYYAYVEGDRERQVYRFVTLTERTAQ
ncbi:hypothetical protein JCM10550A_00770 [Methanogenium cariaci]|jgi:Ca2+/Na+ antiporter